MICRYEGLLIILAFAKLPVKVSALPDCNLANIWHIKYYLSLEMGQIRCKLIICDQNDIKLTGCNF